MPYSGVRHQCRDAHCARFITSVGGNFSPASSQLGNFYQVTESGVPINYNLRKKHGGNYRVGKDTVVSYLCAAGRNTSVCVCKCRHIHTVVCIEFYIRLFLNTHQMHTRVQDRNVLSACLSLRLCWFHFCADMLQLAGMGLSEAALLKLSSGPVQLGRRSGSSKVYLYADFCGGYDGKMDCVGLSLLSSPLVIPNTWSKDPKTSRGNDGIQTKGFVDEYFFPLCFAPGDWLNCYLLCPQGCWRWHILISVWFD